MIGQRRRTVRWRFTVLYAVVFLLSGIGLLVLTYLLSGGSASTPAGNQTGSAELRVRLLEEQLSTVHEQQARPPERWR